MHRIDLLYYAQILLSYPHVSICQSISFLFAYRQRFITLDHTRSWNLIFLYICLWIKDVFCNERLDGQASILILKLVVICTWGDNFKMWLTVFCLLVCPHLVLLVYKATSVCKSLKSERRSKHDEKYEGGKQQKSRREK